MVQMMLAWLCLRSRAAALDKIATQDLQLQLTLYDFVHRFQKLAKLDQDEFVPRCPGFC